MKLRTLPALVILLVLELIASGTGCTLPAKPKRIRAPPRRRCAQWIMLSIDDGGARDAAKE